MSSTLYWRPVRSSGNCLSDGFKFALRDAGRIKGDGGIVLSDHDIAFLQGMFAAGNAETKADAAKLIEAIDKHGEIELWLSY